MTKKLMTLIFAVAVLASCRGREAALTSSYGDRVISGQIVMGEGVANSSPAGVQVSVVGTGMSATLGADGRFAFAGVPEGAELQVSRADGVSARVPATSGVIEITSNGAHAGRTRGSKKGTEPQNQYEGVLQSVAADSLTILDSHNQTVTIALTSTTLIRKGDQTVTAADLVKGDQVHIQAAKVKDVLTAFVVVVQRPDSENEQPEQQFEGIVQSATADTLVILDSHNQTDTIALTSSTVIRKGNTTVAATDLKTGDRVHVKATMVNKVLTATEVIVQNAGEDDGEDGGTGGTIMTANGAVKAVGTSSLTVSSQPRGDVTVNVDGKTIIRKQGQVITLAGIKVGDEVNTMGTRVDDHTLLATQIEVRGSSKR